MTCSKCLCVLVLTSALLHPLPAAAQAVGTATISGTVTDASGAVLPGVTVEAASPALIEGTRTVVTNDAGRFSIVNLRPGIYTVTFTLSGFSTSRREGIELTSDFTANVNSQLSVGGVQETVTVGASAPVVDVQGVAQPRVYTRDVLDALPTGRTPAALMQTIPGVTPGFFGSQFRGTQDSLTMVDGMRATNMIGAGPSLTTAPTSNNVYSEFSFSTNIDSAEVGQPGMRINLVPRDGGNEYRGTVFSTYTRAAWQSSNIDDALRAQGLSEPPKTIKLWDFNPSFGGPILRNALWFQSTYQHNGARTQVIGSFFDADPSPFRYQADQTRPGVNSNAGYSYVQRLTWQATPDDKVSGHYQRQDSRTPFFYSPLLFVTPPPEATLELNVDNNDQFSTRWTRTHTSRLLFETSVLWSESNIINDYRGAAAPWSARNVDSPGLPSGRPAEYAILEITTNQLLGLASVSDANISNSLELRSAATYVTGSHSLKAGVSFFSGTYHRPTSVIGNVVLRTFAGVPNSVVLTLPNNEKERIDGDWAFFVQDRWTTKKLTVNAGLRMDWLMSSVPDQVLPANTWLSDLRVSEQDVLNWKDLSPRLGVAYDLFGNGKTAVKFAHSRFVAGETVNLTGAVNPIRTIATTDTRQWMDLNGDFTIFNADGSVQVAELGPSTNTRFGTAVPGTIYDPDTLRGWFKRGYSWETNVSLQHELIPRVGVTALFYRRTVGNVRVTDNQALTPDSYDTFCITAPADPRLPNSGGERICGLYDLKPTFLGRVQNYVTFAKTLGVNRPDTVTGYELSVNARFGQAFLTGGVNLQNRYTNTCGFIDSPETRFCEQNTSYRPDVKLNGSYLVPKVDVQVSGTYQGLSGPQVTATWNAPGALIAPELGRPLAAGPTATKAIALVEPGTQFLSMRHIFDLRFAKLLRVDRYRFQVMADLYNAFNDNAVSAINTTFGASFISPVNRWLLPTGVTSPRQFRLSAQIDF